MESIITLVLSVVILVVKLCFDDSSSNKVKKKINKMKERIKGVKGKDIIKIILDEIFSIEDETFNKNKKENKKEKIKEEINKKEDLEVNNNLVNEPITSKNSENKVQYKAPKNNKKINNNLDFNKDSLRKAIIYSEIIGKPKAKSGRRCRRWSKRY